MIECLNLVTFNRGFNMSTAELTIKMIEDSNGNIHDINHFLKVYAFAKLICDAECLAPEVQNIVEVAAIVHDIACPLCREKYGNTNGKNQERESEILVRNFLANFEYSQEFINRIVFLVGHHHTLNDINDIDYQVLVEADYLVNAHESNYPEENINHMFNKVFKTKTGKNLLKNIYKVN